VNNGNFSATLTNCSGSISQIQISGINYSASQQSNYSYNFVSPSLNVGNVVVCNNNTTGEFINYSVDGVSTSVNSLATSGIYWVNETKSGPLSGPLNNTLYHIIGAHNNSLSKQFNFVVNTPVGQFIPTTYPLVSISVNSTSHAGSGNSGSATFTHFANAVGDFYEGTMSGQYTTYPGPVVHQVSATFKLQRIQ
jgi:hypothetical protein